MFTSKHLNICRTCALENENMKPIFSNVDYVNDKYSLSTILMSFTSLKIVKGDGLPEQICLQCFEQLDILLSFRRQCKNSDDILRRTLYLPGKGSTEITESSVLSVAARLKDTPEEITNRIKNNEKKDYPCENCDLICWGLGHYRRHILEAHLLKCDNCGQGFKSKKLLICHLLTHNPPERRKNNTKRKKPHTCDICHKAFHFRSNLKRHKLIHTGEKPYLCNVCGRGFAQMSYLKIHSFIHTGEKPYQCNICERCFSAPGTLITHKRTHTGERPHMCRICGKDFPQAGYLASHTRIHTGEKPVQCKVCNRRFNQSGRLNVHMRMHSGEKPYKCEQCGKSFAVRGTLTKHIRTHTGERPYKCSICSQTFAQNGTLGTHMKTHRSK